jgi:aminocarboxymuconate-semialdehyde decarboxylase
MPLVIDCHSVVSLGNPWLDPVTGAESIDWARRINS